MPRLFALSGPDVGRTFDFDDTVLIGRSKEVQIALRSPSISRKHARIEKTQAGWAVVDLGSRNGVKVDGQRVERAELVDQMEFELGELLVRVRLADVTETAPAPVRIEPLADPQLDAPDPDLEVTTITESADTGDDGFELEGDWDAAVPPPPPRPAAPIAEPAAAPVAPQRTAARQPARPSAAERAGIAASRPAGARTTAGGGRVLQYQKHSDSAGFFASDLGQHPAWVRWGAYLLATALFVGLAYGAFRLATTLRQDSADVLTDG